MPNRRIKTNTAGVAELACVSRAASSLEKNTYLRSGDFLAVELLPPFLRALLEFGVARRFFREVIAPEGMYAYVIARTKYLDADLNRALAEGFDQVLILCAGSDTRALRFPSERTAFFELDRQAAQQTKVLKYASRDLESPPNLTYVPMDFDNDSLSEKLTKAGVRRGARSLFIMEGMLMNLRPEAVASTFGTITAFSGTGSRMVFDVFMAGEGKEAPQANSRDDVTVLTGKVDEQPAFSIEKDAIAPYLKKYGFEILELKTPQALEETYFTDERGMAVFRVDPTYCLVTAQQA